MSPETKRRITVLLLFLVAYTYVWHLGPADNPRSREALIRAVADDGVLQIDRYHETTIDKASYRGHYYSDKAVGAALFGLPGYLLAKAIVREQAPADVSNAQALGFLLATYTAASIPSALLVLLLFVLLGRLVASPGWRLLITVGYGLGTLAHPYSQLLYGHQLAAALCLLVFALAFSVKERGATVGRLVAGGLAAGFALITEYPSAIIIVICFIYLFKVADRRHRLWIPIAAALPVISLQLWYNWQCFDNPFSFGYQYEEWSAFKTGMGQGFMGITTPRLGALGGITFGLYRGLFILSPFLLMAIPGFVFWYRWVEWRREFWVALSVVLAFLLLNSSYYMPYGGAGIGPRHLLPALPFMALAIAFCRGRWRWLGVALAVVSIVAISIPTLGGDPQADEELNLISWRASSGFLGGHAQGAEASKLPGILRQALYNWQEDKVAFNHGIFVVTIFSPHGLYGRASLIPYALVWVLGIIAYFRCGRRRGSDRVPSPVAPEVGDHSQGG